MGAAHEPCDVLVIGAGPAGLTAACYLARYRRNVLVVHDGRSRALRIPLTHNAPGFPAGVSGRELVGRMEEQATAYGARIAQDHIDQLSANGDGFIAAGGRTYAARAVIVATGVTLNEVDLPYEEHEKALALGCLRYCPVCDGFEAMDKAVAVLGSCARGAAEALFLREYTKQVTLLPRVAADLSGAERAQLVAAGVKVLDSPLAGLSPGREGMVVRLADGAEHRFDVLYPALGSTPRSELVKQLRLATNEEGCIPTEDGQELAIPGLFAAGDVVDGLDQISVAVGHGAIAATRAHNLLRERDGRVLRP